ncbi:hypothetical protein Dxin01_04311 [Deinococcus xinjiangensis]|uniref:Uncharacterized protein n=1 Tax=Deinococcus xinjiangensis TaxID=457454 RepID=A0ABP9VIY9_9DEIO
MTQNSHPSLGVRFAGQFPAYGDFLKQEFGKKAFNRLIERVERVAYKVALFQDDTGNTATQNRWDLESTDRSFADRNTCDQIASDLLLDLALSWTTSQMSVAAQSELLAAGRHLGQNSNLICPFSNTPILPEFIKESVLSTSRLGKLEVPIDYLDYSMRPLHSCGNLSWFKYLEILFSLREFYSDRKKMISKVQTKAYMTDRRQTGDYPTNREYRWEGHPDSPQFATKFQSI